ncbi:MAG TPA: cytochrome c biogenesis protein ResB [Pyrinomonadaceae bacterium]|nr:cytochrome c biogenesis protein ResB [Pyrinomonadaceae bacterium]
MSAVEETKKDTVVQTGIRPAKAATAVSPLTWILNLLSSVRFGVTLLILLVAASMIGMLIMQQNVEGFDKYYAELTPSQRLLYGSLGFFDIYHAWYFNALLLVLSLNIILASIDRFPKTWKIVSRRKLEAGRKWLAAQQHHAEIVVEGESRNAVTERVGAGMRSIGLKPIVTEKQGRTYVYGERGAWNRLGYLAVHVALLTIFTGGFLTAQFGRDGQMPLMPGSSTSEMTSLTFQLDQVARVPVPLPFTVVCTDIQQKLIKKDGSILQNNTIDWLTRIRIKDEQGERDALVHLNTPYDYRGYRFFQASFISFGQARNITLRLTPTDGSAPLEVTIQRNGSTSLPDGTRIEFENFQPDFTIGPGGKPDSRSGDYNNPAAVLNVTTPSAEQKTVYAFAMELPSGAPVGAPFGGYKYRLADFEKVPLQHVLAVQRDPGKWPFYAGSLMLIAALLSVFLFSHRRVWAMIEEREEGRYAVVLGGNTNRNKLGFEDRFKRLVGLLGGQTREVQQP